MSIKNANPARILVHGRIFQTRLVVFDKDGTLIDFHHLWGQKARLWVETLARQVSGGEALQQALSHGLGYNPAINRVVNDGPLAVASMPKLHTIAAAILYQHGLHWHEAEQHVQASLEASIGKLPTGNLIKLRGDVAGLFQQLTQAGIQIAIITSDDRAATEATLPLLSIEGQISLLVCGDDEIPNKPAPDAIWHIGSRLGVDPAHIMMVGDTASDMITGANAGVGCCVGILHGAGDQAALAAHADVVLDSIDEIQVL